MAVKLSTRLQFSGECVGLTKKYVLGAIAIAPSYAFFAGFNAD